MNYACNTDSESLVGFESDRLDKRSLPFKISGDRPTPAAAKEKDESTSPMKTREKQEDPLQPFKAVSSVSVYEITRA